MLLEKSIQKLGKQKINRCFFKFPFIIICMRRLILPTILVEAKKVNCVTSEKKYPCAINTNRYKVTAMNTHLFPIKSTRHASYSVLACILSNKVLYVP